MLLMNNDPGKGEVGASWSDSPKWIGTATGLALLGIAMRRVLTMFSGKSHAKCEFERLAGDLMEWAGRCDDEMKQHAERINSAPFLDGALHDIRVSQAEWAQYREKRDMCREAISKIKVLQAEAIRIPDKYDVLYAKAQAIFYAAIKG